MCAERALYVIVVGVLLTATVLLVLRPRLAGGVILLLTAIRKKKGAFARDISEGYFFSLLIKEAMDNIILGRLSVSVNKVLGEILAEPHEELYKKGEFKAVLNAAPNGNKEHGVKINALTAIDELMETLTSDVVGYVSFRLNEHLDRDPPRIIDVDVIEKLTRDVLSRTCADIAQADRSRELGAKFIEAYVYVGEIEAWLKRNASAKSKDVLQSIANLKVLLQTGVNYDANIAPVVPTG